MRQDESISKLIIKKWETSPSKLAEIAAAKEFDYFFRIRIFCDGRMDKVPSVDTRFFLAFWAHVLDGVWPEKRQDESLVLLAAERRRAVQTGDYFALSRESLH